MNPSGSLRFLYRASRKFSSPVYGGGGERSEPEGAPRANAPLHFAREGSLPRKRGGKSFAIVPLELHPAVLEAVGVGGVGDKRAGVAIAFGGDPLGVHPVRHQPRLHRISAGL